MAALPDRSQPDRQTDGRSFGRPAGLLAIRVRVLSVVVVADMCFLWTTTKTEIDVRIAYKNKE